MNNTVDIGRIQELVRERNQLVSALKRSLLILRRSLTVNSEIRRNLSRSIIIMETLLSELGEDIIVERGEET